LGQRGPEARSPPGLEGIVRDSAEDIEAGEPVVGGPTLEEMVPVWSTCCGATGAGARRAGPGRARREEERRNQADRLIGYALDDKEALFADQHGAPHALVGGEPVPVNSRSYPWRELVAGAACPWCWPKTPNA
jgi:hypothetical protein